MMNPSRPYLMPMAVLSLWRGHVHLHTTFWLCWLIPMLVLGHLESYLGMIIAIIYFPYGVVSYVGAWRSTRHPTGALWVPNIYKLALVLFLPVLLVTIVGFFTGA